MFFDYKSNFYDKYNKNNQTKNHIKSAAKNNIIFFLKKKQQNGRKKENFRQRNLPQKIKKAEILRMKKISACF